jgi:hypothetical protein
MGGDKVKRVSGRRYHKMDKRSECRGCLAGRCDLATSLARGQQGRGHSCEGEHTYRSLSARHELCPRHWSDCPSRRQRLPSCGASFASAAFPDASVCANGSEGVTKCQRLCDGPNVSRRVQGCPSPCIAYLVAKVVVHLPGGGMRESRRRRADRVSACGRPPEERISLGLRPPSHVPDVLQAGTGRQAPASPRPWGTATRGGFRTSLRGSAAPAA